MSKRNFELERILWPADSLKRTLLKDYPGCKTAAEAVKKAIQDKNQTASQTPKEEDLGDVMRAAIREVEELQKGIDLDLIFQKTREELQSMPLNSKEDITLWKNAWVREIEKLKW